MSCKKKTMTMQVSVFVLVLGLVVLGLSFSSWSNSVNVIFYLTQSYSSCHKDPLEATLEAASMENKTLIITAINKAYTGNNSMLDLFLQSLEQREGTQPLFQQLLIAEFDHCRARSLNCYKVITDGIDFSGEKLFMTEDYVKMMWRRSTVPL